MAKWQNDAMLDAALNYIKNNVTALVLCSAQPATRSEAVTTYALASVAIDSTDVTLADGDTSGRKATVAAQNGVSVTASGTGNHIALVSGSDLLYVTTCTSQVVTSGNTANIGAWDIELADAA